MGRMQFPATPKASVTRFTVLLFVASVGIASAQAQEAPAPELHAGDKWLYQLKIETPPTGSATRHWENTIQRAGAGGMVLATKPVDSNQPPTETLLQDDWSRMVSINGKTVTSNKPFEFPLHPGKTWTLDLTEVHPNPRLKSVRNKMDYKVVGWEEVTVPAGTFKAVKIEADGEWYQEFERTDATASSAVQTGAAGSTAVAQTRAPTTPEPRAGRFYRALWYAPEAKREVKLVYETIGPTGGIMRRETGELESYTVQP